MSLNKDKLYAELMAHFQNVTMTINGVTTKPFDDSDKTKIMTYNGINYTGVQIIAKIIVDSLVDHLLNNLVVTIPANTYVDMVTGGNSTPAVGTLNTSNFNIENPNIN